MGAGGFIQSMIDSLKANKRPNRTIFNKAGKEKITANVLKAAVVKKEISDTELKEIKNRIRLKAFLENKKRLIYSLSTAALLIFTLSFLGFRIYKNALFSQARAIEQNKKINNDDLEKQQNLITEGHKFIKRGDYFGAKEKFFKAAEIDPDNYLLQLGLVICDIRLCYSNKQYCTKAKSSLQKLIQNYGNQPEIKQISKEFNEISANR